MATSSAALALESVEELVALDARHLIHPGRHDDLQRPTVLVRGEGCRLWEAGGRELLDATGGLWLTQIGHGRPEMAAAAARQIEALEYFTSFWHFSNDPSIRLAARLARLAPAGIERVFFTSGGSEANDAAIKAARLFHHRRGERDRTWILSRRHSYHGVSYGGVSATGLPFFQSGFGPLLPHIAHLTPPWPYRQELYAGSDPTEFLIAELEAKIEELGAARIAAMIGEPIMGVGGVLVPPADYWPAVRQVLDRHGILLIADEVVTGYGRTGVWFASEAERMRPDLIVTAKGLTSGYAPLGAVLISDEVGDVLAASEGFLAGYTYFGHPLACALAIENLDIIEREELLDRSTWLGAQLLEELSPLRDLEIVGELRGRGLMIGIELVTDRDSRAPLAGGAERAAAVIQEKHGVIARNVGDVLALSPPLVIEEQQASRAAAAVIDVVGELAAAG